MKVLSKNNFSASKKKKKVKNYFGLFVAAAYRRNNCSNSHSDPQRTQNACKDTNIPEPLSLLLMIGPNVTESHIHLQLFQVTDKPVHFPAQYYKL
jgi:hypothetical protein